MRLSRRRFVQVSCASAVAGVVLSQSPARAEFTVEATAANSTVNWPSRAIQLPPDDGQLKPPVVTAVRLHRDGQMLATAGDDHLVRVWNLADGKRLQRLDGHIDWVRAIDYSPDGKWLASAGNDRRILLWDAATGALGRELAKHEQAIAGLRFSHDSSRLATVGFSGSVRIYDVLQGTLVLERTAPCQDMRTVAFSPDDAVFACGGRSGAIRLLSTSQGEMLRDVVAHRQRIRAIAFSPDGSFLASAGEDRQVHIVPTAHEASSYRLPARPCKVMALVFYGPHLLATAGSDNQIRLWDVAEKNEIGILSGHTGSVAALDCQDGVLVSAGYDTTIRIWTIGDRIAGDKSPAEKRVGTRPRGVYEPVVK